MADSDDFLAVTRVVERSTTLNEMQSRGMVRRLLKQSGLDPRDVTAQQLAAVGRTLLEQALAKNGVKEPQHVAEQWLDCCARQIETARTSERLKVSNTVEEVFTRMGLRR
jgi:hypothetical protein